MRARRCAPQTFGGCANQIPGTNFLKIFDVKFHSIHDMKNFAAINTTTGGYRKLGQVLTSLFRCKCIQFSFIVVLVAFEVSGRQSAIVQSLRASMIKYLHDCVMCTTVAGLHEWHLTWELDQ